MLSLFVTWIHVIAAMLWVGGLLFFSLVLVPSLKGGLSTAVKIDIISRVGLRFRVVGWIALIVILVTGVLRLYQSGRPLGSYDGMFKMKLLLVLVMLALTLLHDLVLGPKSVARSRSSEGPNAIRKMGRYLARLNLLIALWIVYAAVSFVRGF